MAFAPAVVHAGPWLPGPGHFYLELREQLVTTTQGFDAHGTRRPLSTYDGAGLATHARLLDAQSVLYTEIGLATRLAVVADLVLLRSITLPRGGQSTASTIGVGDLRAGLRVKLLDEEVSCALEARLGVPTGKSDGAQPLGPGDLRGELALSFGHVWDRVPVFLAGELGARVRSSGTQRLPPQQVPTAGAPTRVTVDYASELTYGADLGYVARAGERLRVVPRVGLEGRHGLRAPTTAAPASVLVDPLQPASVRLLRVSASLGFDLVLRARAASTPAHLELAISGGAFVWGQGIPAAADIALSLGLSR